MTENEHSFVDALTELVERQVQPVDDEWRNTALDERAKANLINALRPLVFEMARQAVRTALADAQVVEAEL